MPQNFRLLSNTVACNGIFIPPYGLDHFHQVVKMALGINASRKGQTDQFQGGGHFVSMGIFSAEHHTAQLHSSDAALDIERIDQSDAGILRRRDAVEVRVFRDGTVTREALPLWLAEWTILAIPENEPRVARARLVLP